MYGWNIGSYHAPLTVTQYFWIPSLETMIAVVECFSHLYSIVLIISKHFYRSDCTLRVHYFYVRLKYWVISRPTHCDTVFLNTITGNDDCCCWMLVAPLLYSPNHNETLLSIRLHIAVALFLCTAEILGHITPHSLWHSIFEYHHWKRWLLLLNACRTFTL
jgi:hypothetical protein